MIGYVLTTGCLGLAVLTASAGEPGNVPGAAAEQLPPPAPEVDAKPAEEDPYLLPVRRRDSVGEAVADGLQWLADNQQPDGSWGTGLETRGLEIYSRVPGSLDAFKTASTALAAMALRATGGPDGNHADTHAAAVAWLATQGRVRRDQGDLLYNVWAHTYALEALAWEMKAGDDDPQVRQAADYHLDRLLRYETFQGGWNYYDFDVGSRRPSMAPTSFGTAAALAALRAAEEAGLDVPEATITRSLARLRDSRLPGGAFAYGSDGRLTPLAGFNRWQGAAARSQAGTYALWLYEDERTPESAMVHALEQLDRNHVYLNIARKRPLPHEALYQNSGYYYYFGHEYAARMVEALTDPQDRLTHARSVAEKVMPFQEGDGSWWDYAMWDYHKPYGTAYAVLILNRLKPILEEGRDED